MISIYILTDYGRSEAEGIHETPERKVLWYMKRKPNQTATNEDICQGAFGGDTSSAGSAIGSCVRQGLIKKLT